MLQLLLRLLERKGAEGLEAVDAFLRQNLLKKHSTLIDNSAIYNRLLQVRVVSCLILAVGIRKQVIH